jgi:hypothetical protein
MSQLPTRLTRDNSNDLYLKHNFAIQTSISGSCARNRTEIIQSYGNPHRPRRNSAFNDTHGGFL